MNLKKKKKKKKKKKVKKKETYHIIGSHTKRNWYEMWKMQLSDKVCATWTTIHFLSLSNLLFIYI